MLKKIFLQDPSKYVFWIIIAIIVKSLFFCFNISENIPERKTNIIHKLGGDTGSYIEPVENFIKNRSYSPDYRMPGYGIIYFLFRLVFPGLVSLNLLVVTQLFLSGISVYFLALLAREIFSSDKWFYASFYAYLFSTFVSVWDIYILTESFAISSLIFSAYHLVRAVNKFNYFSLAVSGFFLTWAIFLRPVLLPLIGLFIFILLVIWIRDYSFNYSKILKGLAAFLAVFILIDGVWICRNYKVYKEAIPLQRKIEYPELEKDPLYMNLISFELSWGGDIMWWNPRADINWFGYIDNSEHIRRQIKSAGFPGYIYTSKFSYQDLLTVRDYIARSKDGAIPRDKRDAYARSAAEKLKDYEESIKVEKPVVYYIYAPLNVFRKSLFYSGTVNLFNRTYNELNYIELGFKILMSLIYLFVVIGGLAGAMILFFKNYMINIKLFIAAVSLYCSVIYPVGFRYADLRYFAPAYPFMLLCALYFSFEVYNTILNQRKKKLILGAM